jgi:thiol:disulfide interchange protein DsbD
MRLPRLIFVLFSLLASRLPALAASASADTEHLHVQLVIPEKQFSAGGMNEVGLYFKLEPGWHIYWKNPGDSGEPPHIQWTLPTGISSTSMEFPAPKRLPLGPLMDFGYENQAVFPLDIVVEPSVKPGPVVLHAKVDWLVCREVCIPGKADLEESVRIVRGKPVPGQFIYGDHELMEWSREQLPLSQPAEFKAVFQPLANGFRLQVDTGHRQAQAIFFPEDQDVVDNPAPQKLTPTPKGFILDLKKDASLKENPTQLKGVLELSYGNYEIVALSSGAATAIAVTADAANTTQAAQATTSGAEQPAAQAQSSATQAQSAAQVANSAATVAPALSLTELLRATGLAFLGGLLLNLMPCVFPVLFIKGLALVNSGNEERHKLRAHGFVYATGILVSFWTLVAVLLGLRAAGSSLGWGFQFQSPVFLALMAGLLFFLGLSLAGQFEIGLTLTGAGGSLALKQGYTGSFFTGVLAVVVATPCTAPFMGAAVGYALAQPAVVTFAVFTALALGLAAPYVALTLQPAWTRLLPRPGVWMEILRQAIAVPIFATVIWLAWVLASGYGASVLVGLLASFLLLAIAGWFLGRWPVKRWATTVAAVILLGVVALAVYSRTLAEAPAAAPAESAARSAWEPWSADAVARYQSQGRPVFVDFTASWCLSCQVNERVALQQPEVQKAFADTNIVLLKADWTRHDDAITQALAGLGRSGVPAYVLYAPGQSSPQLLPEALTPGIVIDSLSSLPKNAR